MLISTLSELQAVYINSSWDNIDYLLPLFDRVERTKLAKYLGLPLLSMLNEQYRSIIDSQGALMTHVDDDEGLSDIVTLLRTCQEVIIYIALSNNVRILTSSLNQGGGFNAMTTNDYDQSSDTQLKALSQELWNNAMDSLDSMLVFLEQDAQGAQRFTSLWKHSQYYYLHSDLVFRTADELSHYLPLDGGRAGYIRLTPGLRNAQNQYIEPRIDSELLQLVILDDPSKFVVDRLPDGSMPDGDAKLLFTIFSRHIRMALANYTNIELLRIKGSTDKNSTQSRARSEMQNDYHEYGDREMSIALDIIINNPLIFAHYITCSRILQYEYQRKMGSTWKSFTDSLIPQDPAPCSCKSKNQIPMRKSHDALIDLGGWHFM